MATLLHISDLHRTPGPRLFNCDLLSAIVSDAERWPEEGIPWPDLIVVSGDLIQGTSADASDSDKKIEVQYAEAGDLLRQMASRFVDSDLSRVVIVPGNHDVNWSRARNAMQPLHDCPPEIETEAFRASSEIRWDWKGQQAYRIVDTELYQSRLEQFRKFQADFYADVKPHPLSHGVCKDLGFFEYPSLGLVVVGFASWHGNDCFCHVGEIDPESLAASQQLIDKSEASIAVGVWHHNVEGGPRAHDYMDQHIIHRLIDFGFSVGLHGHQHYPGAIPFELRSLNHASMAVVGAGSLSVGNNQLPMGERREFNIVVIDQETTAITVHARGMSQSGVITASHREDFGGNSFITLPLPTSPKRRNRPANLRVLDEAAEAVVSGQYDEALKLLDAIKGPQSEAKRTIQVEALKGLGRKVDLITLLDPPQNAEEVVMLVTCLLDLRNFDRADALLENSTQLVDKSVLEELQKTILIRRMLS